MFAVFGKSYEAAKKKALKLTPTHTGTGASYRKLTDAEYQKELAENTEKLFEKMKPVALSREYSSPEICTEFMRLAERQGYQGLTVRIKAPVQSTDKKGRAKIANRWVRYVPGNDYSNPDRNGLIQ